MTNNYKVTGTDLLLNDYPINWTQTVNRVTFVCPSRHLVETEQILKKRLMNWAVANDASFIDMESIAELYLVPKLKQLDNFHKQRHCNNCDYYAGSPIVSPNLDFQEVMDVKLRLLLADYFDVPEPDKFNYAKFIGNYVFYFSSHLLFLAAQCENYNDLLLLRASTYYWRRTRVLGCPSFMLCDENLFWNTKSWRGIEPVPILGSVVNIDNSSPSLNPAIVFRFSGVNYVSISDRDATKL